jgi:hypothetical protein
MLVAHGNLLFVLNGPLIFHIQHLVLMLHYNSSEIRESYTLNQAIPY